MSEKQKHPKKPTDLGQDFIKSGMRLITQQSADKYLSDITYPLNENPKDDDK
jgi:hypothetical protein